MNSCNGTGRPASPVPQLVSDKLMLFFPHRIAANQMRITITIIIHIQLHDKKNEMGFEFIKCHRQKPIII